MAIKRFETAKEREFAPPKGGECGLEALGSEENISSTA